MAKDHPTGQSGLYQAFLQLKTPEQCYRFLQDVCSYSEPVSSTHLDVYKRQLLRQSKKSPRSSPARAFLMLTAESNVLGQELLDGCCSSFLVVALDLDGNGLTLLDAHAHQKFLTENV